MTLTAGGTHIFVWHRPCQNWQRSWQCFNKLFL